MNRVIHLVIRCMATAAFLTISSVCLAETCTVIHTGTLFAEPGTAPALNQSIVVEDGLIRSIESGIAHHDCANVIELGDAFVLPGLIDAHVHLQFGGNDYSGDLTGSEDGTVTFRAFAQARLALLAGFTTLRDLAGDPDVVFSLRDAINSGIVQGPRIFASGRAIVPTGGGIVHGLRLRRDIKAGLEDSNLETQCNGPVDCARVTRRVIAEGADVVKIIVTGSILEPKLTQQMTEAEVVAIVETARSMGRTVAAAALDPESIVTAVDAGANSIEHGSFADRESIELLARSGVYLVPTLTSIELLEEQARSNPTIPLIARENVLAAAARLPELLMLASRRGVNIAFGTDVKVGMLGKNAHEFKLLKGIGISETEMIRSATVVAAEMMGISHQVGTLAPGKRADIIAVLRDPLVDIEALGDVIFVMKGGDVVLDRRL